MLEYTLPLILMLLGLWIITTIPVYISAKIFTAGRIGFGQAMGATLLGPLTYLTVFFISNLALTITNNTSFTILAFIISIFAWLGTFKVIFKTGWLRTIGIVTVAVIIFIIAAAIISFIALIIMPNIPSNILPVPQISV